MVGVMTFVSKRMRPMSKIMVKTVAAGLAGLAAALAEKYVLN